MKQPEALRLADALMEPVVLDKHAMQAAAELRRLHDELISSNTHAELTDLDCIRLEAEIAALKEENERLHQINQSHEMKLSVRGYENQIADLKVDAERYRWLRDTLHSAVGGGVTVNDERLVYQTPEPGEEVRVYWYPATPVGFYESKAATLDEAVDAARGEA